MNPNFIKDGVYYNPDTATLLCWNDGVDGPNKWYKSKTGRYFRTKVNKWKLNPTIDDEKLELEIDFNQMRRILEYCQSKTAYFGRSEIYHIPDEFLEVKEV